MTIEGKLFGRGRALFPSFSLEQESTITLTLSALIEQVVRQQVALFRERQDERSVLRALSAEAIAEGAAHGKIAPGLPGEKQTVDADAAVAHALTAFGDGVFFVFVDDQQIEHLEQSVVLHPESRVTFLRLVALAGG